MALPANAVAVVTDTTAYLPEEVLRENDIHLVSLYVNWQGRSEREIEMLDLDSFYERLRGTDKLPTTSQPSIGDFLDVYKPLLEAGRDIVSLHISGAISGTVESARQAVEQLGDDAGRVTVIDTRSGCGGQGLMVLAAAKAALSGADTAEVQRRAHAARADFKMWFAVDSLEYLRRGGRIGAASAFLGMALRVKPILTFDGEVTPVERVRTSARAVRRLTEYAEERARDGADGWVVQHVQAPVEAEQLIAATEKIMGKPPLWTSEIGPVIGVHVGPGLLGVGGIPLSHLA
jgi:DegV family protein with EDD domain